MRKHVNEDLLTCPQPSPECALSGVVPCWGVVGGYIVSGGILRESDRSEMRAYNPFAEYELPTQVARIVTGDVSPEEFAGKFGLLGHDHLVSRRECKGGDPIEWVRAHSRTVALCLDLIGVLEEGDEVVIGDAVETTRPGPYIWGQRIGKLPTRFTDHSLKKNVPPAAIARNWLTRLITDNIQGITRRLSTDAYGSRLASYFSFKAMIETVYWQLADRVEGGGVRRCLECRRFFLTRDKRQQYCPPYPGSTRSRCSSRVNVNSFRSRHTGHKEIT